MLLDIPFLDDSTRPEIPKLEGVTEAQRGPGRHLAEVHDSFRENMRILRKAIEAAGQSEAAAKAAKEAAESLPLLSNYRRFGNLCGQHCAIIEMHHSLEDQMIFPALSAKGEAFRAVVDRLKAEHEIVHRLLERLIGQLEALVQAPDAAKFAAARETYDALERVLLSHFGYEEAGIGDALGYFNLVA